MSTRDRLFWRFVACLFAMAGLYGLAMAIVLIFGDEALGLRMINVFAVMFSSIVSLGTGYLLGVTGDDDKGDDDKN